MDGYQEGQELSGLRQGQKAELYCPLEATSFKRCAVHYAVLKTGTIGRVILEEWFPSDEDKQSVYNLINKMEPNLNQQEWENLQLWKQKNPIE